MFQVSKETLIAAFNLSQADDLVEKPEIIGTINQFTQEKISKTPPSISANQNFASINSFSIIKSLSFISQYFKELQNVALANIKFNYSLKCERCKNVFGMSQEHFFYRTGVKTIDRTGYTFNNRIKARHDCNENDYIINFDKVPALYYIELSSDEDQDVKINYLKTKASMVKFKPPQREMAYYRVLGLVYAKRNLSEYACTVMFGDEYYVVTDKKLRDRYKLNVFREDLALVGVFYKSCKMNEKNPSFISFFSDLETKIKEPVIENIVAREGVKEQQENDSEKKLVKQFESLNIENNEKSKKSKNIIEEKKSFQINFVSGKEEKKVEKKENRRKKPKKRKGPTESEIYISQAFLLDHKEKIQFVYIKTEDLYQDSKKTKLCRYCKVHNPKTIQKCYNCKRDLTDPSNNV